MAEVVGEVVGETPDGRPIRKLALGREPGVTLELLDLGATVGRLEVADADGVRRNVVLGHRSPEGYCGTSSYLGATVGRYANRIAAGRFELDGEAVVVGVHDRGQHLHGGPYGFDQRTWELVAATADHARLRLVSPDGDQGFPGTLVVEVEYRVIGVEVQVAFEARTDRVTVVNLTQHSYFNLNGEGSGSVDDHLLKVEADTYTPVDDRAIPLDGPPETVQGTPFDFRVAKPLGAAVRVPHEQVVSARGIDHNLVIRGAGWRSAAVLESTRSGIVLDVLTDQPGLQVYTGNYLDGTVVGRSGTLYRQGDGIALEPQAFPNTPNRPDFGSAVLRPGELYTARLAWRFTQPGLTGSVRRG